VVLSVPQTYPVRPLNGHLVSCFLTPGIDSAFTYPAVFRQEVLRVAPDYRFDVKNFRTDDKDALLRQLVDLAEVQLKLALHCLTTKPWDLFMHVNIGLDRMQHGFWRYHDPRHRLYEPGSRFASAIISYYRMLDDMAGQMTARAGDDTLVLIVSDHGVKRMDGGICVNEWLWRTGWLAFHSPPPEGQLTRFEDMDVDWARTRAWASGGYYGRVFLNVAGREPQGVIPAAAYADTRAELAALLAALPGPAGEPLNTRVYQPEDIYSVVRGVAPDLLVYFGDLHWRAVGSLGHDRHYTLENDTGPDDANHAQQGMFVLYDPRRRGAGRVEGAQLMDIAPTLLHRLGQPVPPAMQGRVL
jgi:predicted AlkP superfamily phosphohydrolase/phosphomutase